MKLNKCENGHFYDSDKFASCPHCASEGGANETVALHKAAAGDLDVATVTIPRQDLNDGGAQIDPNLKKEIKIASQRDDQPTVGFWSSQKDEPGATFEPVVGWLVCVKGKSCGQDYRLKSGRNFVGRSETMDVCLKGEERVSREKHSIVTFDPAQNRFLVQPGESRELCYLNGELIVSAVALKRGDILQVGDVKLMFIPCCDENFCWSADSNQ